jgi:methionyl-tRNA formyltransferase
MSAPKTVLFCGTPAFAIPALRAVHACPDLQITAVVTQPDRPVGRTKELTAPPVKDVALELGLTVLQPEQVNTELPAVLTEPPDYLVTVAYGELIKDALLTLPRISPINVHPSLLPRWRGASPLQHTILAGDTEAGTTIQVMGAELDAGDILAQERVAVLPRETTATLHDKLATLSATLLVQVLTHPLSPTPQSANGITFCKKLARENGIVDPTTMDAETIDRTVRALHPWPGVSCSVQGEEVKLHATSLEPQSSALALPCSNGTTLYVLQIQSAGKRVMTGEEWQRGRRQ